MRTIIFLFIKFMAITPTSSKAGETTKACPSKMSASVEKRLLPVLETLDKAAKKNDWFDKNYEQQFEKLLRAKDNASREARVALMDYYVGEGMGEELVCAVALDGNGIKPIVELYQRCDISPTISLVPRNRSLPLRTFVLKMLKQGHVKEDCTKSR